MKYQLAQLNIARFKLPMHDPVNADFVNNIDRVNSQAESAPGFIWRLASDGDNEAIADESEQDMIINMSVWQDIDSLMEFTYYNKAHLSIMKRRKEWFEKMDVHLVMWWITAGHIPTLDEAKQRLEHLRENGSSPHAFTFARAFDAAGLTYSYKHAKCG